jgi:hypothetical protein
MNMKIAKLRELGKRSIDRERLALVEHFDPHPLYKIVPGGSKIGKGADKEVCFFKRGKNP